jgi:hypothetical protein
MTTIAYKRGMMACDSCWTDAGEAVQQTSLIKIVRLSSGALFGSSGDNDCRAVELLLDKIKTFDKLPTAIQLADTHCDCVGILAFKTGEAVIIEIKEPEAGEQVEWRASVYRANRGCAGVGTGGELAIGAMEAGATASQAVKIACGWDINSKPPVHVIQLGVKKKVISSRNSRR